jgi:hypothetical protein
MEKHHEVKIFIDKEPKESPNPTTGHALYVLGHIDPTNYDPTISLFEVSGPCTGKNTSTQALAKHALRLSNGLKNKRCRKLRAEILVVGGMNRYFRN